MATTERIMRGQGDETGYEMLQAQTTPFKVWKVYIFIRSKSSLCRRGKTSHYSAMWCRGCFRKTGTCGVLNNTGDPVPPCAQVTAGQLGRGATKTVEDLIGRLVPRPAGAGGRRKTRGRRYRNRYLRRRKTRSRRV